MPITLASGPLGPVFYTFGNLCKMSVSGSLPHSICFTIHLGPVYRELRVYLLPLIFALFSLLLYNIRFKERKRKEKQCVRNSNPESRALRLSNCIFDWLCSAPSRETEPARLRFILAWGSTGSLNLIYGPGGLVSDCWLAAIIPSEIDLSPQNF